MFFIASLPRTRTHWLAQYFNGMPGVTCYHELLNGLHTKQAFYDAMEAPGEIGNSDSGLFLTDFQERWPDAPTLIVERPVEDVYSSLCAYFEQQGHPRPSMQFLMQQKRIVDSLKGLRIQYSELDKRLSDIHQYFGIPFDEVYAKRMAKINLQIPVLTTDIDSYKLWGVG